MSKKSAVEKSIERHRAKKALRDRQSSKRGGDHGVPYGCGMGWPERKDFETQAEYLAYLAETRRKSRWPTRQEIELKMARDPEYTPNHDNRVYAIV